MDRTLLACIRSLRPPISVASLLLLSLAASLVAAQDDHQPISGGVQGSIRYRGEASRPWRYARYYVKQAKAGFLAEAVVALSADSLQNAPDNANAQTHAMDQKNFQFIPETLSIRAGDTVSFTNSDRETHNVKTAGLLADFSKNTLSGVAVTYRFEHAGGINRPVRIGCAYHGAMRAWIYVFDHPYHQVTGETGRFHFQQVPTGNYVLEIRHPAGELRYRQPIEVQPGMPLNVDVQLTPDHKLGR